MYQWVTDGRDYLKRSQGSYFHYGSPRGIFEKLLILKRK